jgi:hypothetical protein
LGKEAYLKHECKLVKVDTAYVNWAGHTVTVEVEKEGKSWSRIIVFWTLEIIEVEAHGPYHILVSGASGSEAYCTRKVY